MENNNEHSNDSFYSYNNQSTGYQNDPYRNSGYGNPGGTGANSGYGNPGGTGAGGYGNPGGSYQSSGYGTQGTYQSSYGNQGNPPYPDGRNKKKKEKKPGGFGTKLAKSAAIALVFGLVAGVAFEGVQRVSDEIFGEPQTQAQAGDGDVLTTSDGDGGVKATAVSSTYVGTDVSDIVDAVMPSIVAITNVSETEYQSFWGGSQTYESTSAGSGIIVSKDDDNLYIATNNHVVEGTKSLTVTFDDNSTVSAEIKGTDPSTDLAVIRVSLDSIEKDTMDYIKVATLGDSDELRVGQASIAIGNALGYGQSVTTGCISALDREVTIDDANTSYTAELIQTDAAINPGNSGGALLNAAGEVIGINSVKYSDTEVEGIGYAIPMSTAMPIIEDLITKEKVDESESAYLGIAGVDVTSDVAETYSMPEGVFVIQLTDNSAAAKAGILKGDIITKFDGKKISSMEDLSTRLQYYKAGTVVDVTVMRANNGQYEEQVISVELGKKI